MQNQNTFDPPTAPEVEPFSQEDLAKLQELEQAESGEPVEEQTSERPDWLPEKFESPEALAQAYASLEEKMGTTEQQEPESSETAGDSPVPEGFWEEAAQSYQETGGSTEEQLKTMTDMGIPQPMVDTYMRGLEAIVAQQTADVYASVGGEEEYGAMMEWAQKNLSSEDQATHNRAVDAGDSESAKLAIKGLYAQYKNATSGGPNMVTGKAPQFGGVEPFDDRQQVTEAMRDPRYRTSPSYRAEVERRLAATNIFD